jgi:aryl carrier-like protein
VLRDIVGDNNSQTHAHDLQLTLLDGIQQEGAFDFTLEVFESKDGFKLDFKYNAELFEPTTIEKMMSHLLLLIQQIISNPDMTMANYIQPPASPVTRAQERPDRVYASPRNALEELLVDFWRQTLDVSRVSIYDNFFQLGGDPTSGAQIIARARQFGLHFTIEQLAQHPTIADLMEYFLADKTKARQIKRLITLLSQLKKQKRVTK